MGVVRIEGWQFLISAFTLCFEWGNTSSAKSANCGSLSLLGDFQVT